MLDICKITDVFKRLEYLFARKKGVVRRYNMRIINRFCFVIISLVSFILFNGHIYAAEIVGQRGLSGEIEILISGNIERGDLEKIEILLATMLSELSEFEHPRVIFSLDTKGGDIDEAIKIGRFARNMLVQTMVIGKVFFTPESEEGKAISKDPLLMSSSILSSWVILAAEKELEEHHLTKAHSAGVIIFYGGVERWIQDNTDKRNNGDNPVLIPVIGIHRPYYNKKYFASLAPVEAGVSYRYLEKRVRDYFTEMGAPQSLIDRIFNSSSTEIELIPKTEFTKMFREKESFVEEWLIAKCGEPGTENALTPRELKDFEQLEETEKKQRAAMSLKGGGDVKDIPVYLFENEYGEKLLNKVRDHDFQVHNCQKFAKSNHQKEWANKYLAGSGTKK